MVVVVVICSSSSGVSVRGSGNDSGSESDN